MAEPQVDTGGEAAVALAGDHDQILGTRQGAKVTRDTERFPGLRIDVETRSPAKAFGNKRTFKRVLFGIVFGRPLMTECQPQTSQEVQQQEPFPP